MKFGRSMARHDGEDQKRRASELAEQRIIHRPDFDFKALVDPLLVGNKPDSELLTEQFSLGTQQMVRLFISQNSGKSDSLTRHLDEELAFRTSAFCSLVADTAKHLSRFQPALYTPNSYRHQLRLGCSTLLRRCLGVIQMGGTANQSI